MQSCWETPPATINKPEVCKCHMLQKSILYNLKMMKTIIAIWIFFFGLFQKRNFYKKKINAQNRINVCLRCLQKRFWFFAKTKNTKKKFFANVLFHCLRTRTNDCYPTDNHSFCWYHWYNIFLFRNFCPYWKTKETKNEKSNSLF